ncbi:SCO1860 family LAETG-anchored protein [Streptomyces lavendofoliae]|uniref:LPXTG cell wall anchor domain-containing protein n=1 Tax=Streptomyces lavendofoliae TaxID=67314 RepID=A0A918HSW6_9ACTN|nr:SCO1860 family LAETG-anchored protein [Streptomyces lavendofoliae]GGU21623.1 LPXTG cell wall anchor domain-containing protein [Streptomyces lavendofoliae]
MNSTTLRPPVRRRTLAAVAAAALTAGPALLAAPAAHATGDKGRATAVVLRTDLDVALLDKTVHVPLAATLNEVQAPASARRTALTVTLDGVEQGRPVSVLKADVATAEATADERRSEGRTELAHAKLHVPGLPLLSLIEVEKVTSRALCEAGARPVAEANLLGAVTVLGKRVTLTTGGTTRAEVPGVGEVTLDLSKTRTTSRTAAATALALRVSVNPLKANVADVTGTVTLAEATCETPKAPAKPTGNEPADVRPQTAGGPSEADLAETGGSSLTPYLAGGSLALLAAGAGALALNRRARAARARD